VSDTAAGPHPARGFVIGVSVAFYSIQFV